MVREYIFNLEVHYNKKKEGRGGGGGGGAQLCQFIITLLLSWSQLKRLYARTSLTLNSHSTHWDKR